MLFKEIIGQEKWKDQLIKSVDSGRIPHAQLFVAPKGAGGLPLALAYAQYILCKPLSRDINTEQDPCSQKFKNFAHPDLHFAFPLQPHQK